MCSMVMVLDPQAQGWEDDDRQGFWCACWQGGERRSRHLQGEKRGGKLVT